ncbi:MAG: isoleucine--tRNA ligase [Pirellulales bacterium]|nr:isoleucine--tRNA ligase [Pirellulales bacterium]
MPAERPVFPEPKGSPNFPEMELGLIRLWNERKIYDKSLAARKSENAPRFVFYEGPPTANGLPHPGHCLTRAIKDLFPRYRTMRGYLCERKAGWDTHGLPVEVEVSKELGIHSKEEIEAYGIEPFIHRCIESVFRYTQQWERLTERIGFWIRLDEAYVTYHQSFIESVWWALANLFNRGLLYQGHKIVWWWAQGGTALSSGEVGQGYREVADPSVYVRFPLVDAPRELADTDLLVWTTTPWTLPSNQFAAVHPELDYAVVRVAEEQRRLILAAALVETIAAKVGKEFTVERTLRGADLIGLRYQPPFDYYYQTLGARRGGLMAGGSQQVAWRVVAADFVTVDSGTGVVHQAPAFGEVDFELLTSEQARFAPGEGPELICAVGPDGRFTDEAPDWKGRWVKEADKDISRELRRRELLFHLEQYLHDYPFCWRSDEDPLIQYPRKSWFIRTTEFKDRMLANNSRINWLPEHIRDGRFGNFLETNVDWAISRERYWGTPLPIWVCEATGHMEAIASYDELLAKPGIAGTDVWEAAKKANPQLSDHLRVHKPYIDAVTYDSPRAPGKRMRRVTEVIDCWFDSGAMPFAQWGYPHQGAERFAEQFPADFISEAIDQTRGWFYSQLAISTLLFGDEAKKNVPACKPVDYPHPFRNCIVLGLMLGEDGQKMSKSKRNYREPNEIFDRYGADALRWYFFANQPPWTSIRYSEQAIKESIPEFLLRLWNVYSFFVIYANIDGFDPAARLRGEAGQLDDAVLARADGYRPIAERGELDRWLLGELHRTTQFVTERMDAYDNYAACGQITEFVDALSNWYVRRSRDRFWSNDAGPDKTDAYWTLYECLVTTSKLIASFVPFLAESLWQNLVVAPFHQRAVESVHLCNFPAAREEAIDAKLSAEMHLVREIVSLGRSARMGAKLKVRQPLSKVEIILAEPSHQAWLEQHAPLIREELNVHQVEFTRAADEYIEYTVLPDLKKLGPKLGKRLPALKSTLAQADAAALLRELESSGVVKLALPDGELALDRDDLQIRLQAKPGWAAAHGPEAVVVLAAELTDELLAEGRARELVHLIQGRRKDLSCAYTDRIAVGVVTDSTEVHAAMSAHGDYIRTETLALELTHEALPGVDPVEAKLDGATLHLYVKVAANG